eukprot:CAMPEP_0170531484 /NCGR_PEP_ID=MMETSP0209-20121228/62262_1 /TAXON_ID=665100 ORGANISM="Litonotus pictus, Strain P1" /NCGR_SAMPLE_ID=MMETSP0209 /ASSEMBLY_ACC=CAM_ASM_000301 /LENGTH=399 /DNA_ID=CAMNT_0010826175 /DNA_START=45 /DNA_END=1241 /DNA_ORIENTATION=+
MNNSNLVKIDGVKSHLEMIENINSGLEKKQEAEQPEQAQAQALKPRKEDICVPENQPASVKNPSKNNQSPQIQEVSLSNILKQTSSGVKQEEKSNFILNKLNALHNTVKSKKKSSENVDIEEFDLNDPASDGQMEKRSKDADVKEKEGKKEEEKEKERFEEQFNNYFKDNSYEHSSLCRGGLSQERYISTEMEKKLPSLVLTPVQGDAIKETLCITAGGLKNSNRGARDGVVLFGSNPEIESTKKKVDYVINSQNMKESTEFMIYFSKENEKFYLRVFNNSSSQMEYKPNDIMVQISQPYYLKRKEMIIINDCSFLLKPNNGYIEVKNLSKYLQSSSALTFLSKDTKEIKIGREKSCHILLNWDKSYSKHQCSILWDEDFEQWKLVDGGTKGPSKNGTW